MMERIEKAAFVSVGRAMGFAGLAIGTFMIGMSANPQLCFKTGGILVMLTCAILILKAIWVETQPYKQTEVWLMLRQEDRPTAETAQQIISGVLREIYLQFAERMAAVACGMFLVTIGLGFAGVTAFS
jgi:hypothetical protein